MKDNKYVRRVYLGKDEDALLWTLWCDYCRVHVEDEHDHRHETWWGKK